LMMVKDPAKWKKWYPGLDSAQILTVGETVKGVILDNSDPANPVTLAITNVSDSEVTAQFSSKKMRPVVNVWRTFAYPAGDSVTVHWYMDFHLRWYPWEKFSSLLLESSYGSKMEHGLFNLKKLLQSPANREQTQ